MGLYLDLGLGRKNKIIKYLYSTGLIFEVPFGGDLVGGREIALGKIRVEAILASGYQGAKTKSPSMTFTIGAGL